MIEINKNNLSNDLSPYLKQHKDNPVNWQIWSKEILKFSKQNKKPIQLDLFEPYEYGYEFKVIVTNKTQQTRAVLKFHNGRGSQEGIIGEVKSHCFQDYVPVQSLNGNKAFLFSGIIAHNLTSRNKTPTVRIS